MKACELIFIYVIFIKIFIIKWISVITCSKNKMIELK